MGYYPRLRDLREDQDLTQRQLALFLGMPQPQYCRYERGVQGHPHRPAHCAWQILPHIHRLYPGTHQQFRSPEPVKEKRSEAVLQHASLLFFYPSLIQTCIAPCFRLPQRK